MATPAKASAKSEAVKPEVKNEQQKSEPVKPRRGFEVLGTLHMGRKGDVADIRNSGDTVYEDELEKEMTQYLLGKGEIADRNAPVPPSQADKTLAYDHLFDVARQVKAVKVDGGSFQLAGEDTPHKGLAEFRRNVTIDQLKSAIVTKFKE
jgi:hypothetical protein